MIPRAEHVCDVGMNRPIRWNSRPCSRALYSSMATNADHPASWTDLAMRVRASPLTASWPRGAKTAMASAAWRTGSGNDLDRSRQRPRHPASR